jgi:hypothetical protein
MAIYIPRKIINTKPLFSGVMGDMSNLSDYFNLYGELLIDYTGCNECNSIGEGYSYNWDTNECVFTGCPQGQVKDENTGSCINDPCYSRDECGDCLPYGYSLQSCSQMDSNSHLDCTSKQCTCNSGYILDQTIGKCVIPVSSPSIYSTAATNITQTTATSGGTITSDGGVTIIARGVCWSTSANPTISDSKTNDGAAPGTFISNITGLSENTTYYVRAYATNASNLIGYGADISFKTDHTGCTVDQDEWNHTCLTKCLSTETRNITTGACEPIVINCDPGYEKDIAGNCVKISGSGLPTWAIFAGIGLLALLLLTNRDSDK